MKRLVILAAAGLVLIAAMGAWLLRSRAQPSSAQCAPIDHQHRGLDALLRRHVRPDGVDYEGLRADRAELRTYLDGLEVVCRSTLDAASDAEQLAFWFNAYNAYTLDLIVEHYPVQSIRDIGALPLQAFWQRSIPLRAAGNVTSLFAIENDILRRRYDEPRLHFALVCASRSCPALRPEAYAAERLEAHLQSQTRSFLADPSKNRREGETLYLSALFDWYADDFGDALDYVGAHAPHLTRGAPAIEFLPYDWSLNDARSSATSVSGR